MNLVIAYPLLQPFAALLAERLGPGHPLRFVHPGEFDGPGGIEKDVQVLVTARFPAAWGARFPALKLLQAAGAGVEKIDTAALPPGTRLCNTFGHGPSIAEHVIMVMLALQRNLMPADRALRAGRWLCPQFDPAVPLPDTLAGKTVVILGTGDIGTATARLCRQFGLDCLGLNRTGRVPEGSPFARCRALTALDDVLPAADFIVIALPLADNTCGLLDRARLARLKPSAFLVNIARGPIVEEAALFEALQNRALGGAALDVWYAYPAPGAHEGAPAKLPFADLANVILTPHMSGVTRATFQQRAEDIAHNVHALAAGTPLRHEILFRPSGRAAQAPS